MKIISVISLIAMMLTVLVLAGCSSATPVKPPVPVKPTEATTGTPSPETSEQAAATQTKAETAEEKALAYLSAQGKSGYVTQMRVVYADRVVITLGKTGVAETISLSVDSKTGEVKPEPIK